MSANPPPTAQATQAPSQIELFWDRYKSIVYVVLLATIGALVVNYGYKKYQQSQKDAKGAAFAEQLGLRAAYTDPAQSINALTDQLESIDASKLQPSAIAAAPEWQRPFLLMASAKKAVRAKDWAAAEAALRELETKYPQHSLVKSSEHPVQAQEEVKRDPADVAPGSKPKPPEWKPAIAGSQVSLMRAQIESAKSFTAPDQFAQQPIPETATKVKFELSSGDTFTLALLPETPLHRAKFLELAEQQPEPFWKGIAIDEIRRPTKNGHQPRELHLGLESTRKEDRAEWTDTEPSKQVVDFEKTKYSHFAGAVSGRNEKDGKSAVDRFWIAVDDAPQYDGDRVIFAYVVEGLESLKRVCESTMTAQEEEVGRGKPSETIRVTNVTVIK